jgi:predicted hydrolase (HD superfamily)
MTLNKEAAMSLLHSKMQNQNLRRHCYAVSIVLKAYYEFYKGEGRDLGNLTHEDWEVAGLLHDSDYEITKDDWSKHVITLLEWLKDYEVKDEVRTALSSHNYKTTGLREPQTLLEWTLECCDELTGFIVATALIMPTKKLSEVTVDGVVKRFGQPAFARAVDRSQITQCEEKVGVPLEKFIDVSLEAMQRNSDLLGL